VGSALEIANSGITTVCTGPLINPAPGEPYRLGIRPIIKMKNVFFDEKEIRKYYSLYTTTFGKTPDDARYNIRLELKRKFGFRFWIYDNGPIVALIPPVLLFFLLQYIVQVLFSPSSLEIGILYFFIVLTVSFVSYKILGEVVKNIMREVTEYGYKLKQIAEDEFSNRE
jgi:hypothetical protein